MSQLSLDKLRLKLDDWRVSLHFKRVEGILRHNNVNNLLPDLQKARQQHLNQLHMYAARGVFPRNYERPTYAPCFIDRDGRECAVAHLVMTSGQPDLAYEIANTANYAYVPQMTFPELDTWAAQTGLSKKELAFIQPSYYSALDNSVLWMLFVACTTGFVTVLINAVQIARQRKGIVVPVAGLVIATILLAISLFYLDSARIAHEIATTPNVISLRKMGPYLLYALISLGFTLLTGGLALYRIGHFRGVKQATTGENQS